ncbi:ISNCY family transposase [Endozoicomonas sp. ALC013]|uniref:ISNCY family transposase n=1 Tax=Endozoicomonas sp. ALC013 TaxID=3403076 RepID=UPI003BB59199
MRQTIKPQMQLGEVDISAITFNPKSRDDIPRLLRAFQHIWITPELREQVFRALERMIPASRDNGRPGMDLWKILIFGTLRLTINCDYDRLQELANEHGTLRQMLGHGPYCTHSYHIQTLQDNIALFTPEILDGINQIVVNAGHQLVKKKEERICARADSFVVKTNAHFPTDINLLRDAVRKMIEWAACLSSEQQESLWRQSNYLQDQHKKRFHKARNLKRSTSSNESLREARQHDIETVHAEYVAYSQKLIRKAEITLNLLKARIPGDLRLKELERWIKDADYQCQLIIRRVLNHETIPHSEKVFSLFERHTEWISKGKAGVPVELGLRVCVLQDQFGFTLHHLVMEKQTDDQVTVAIAKGAKQRFPEVSQVSYDRGFWSKENLEKLETFLDRAVLPKKGRWSEQDRKRERHPEFVRAMKKHSAVESDINALEQHGLDRCPDSGIDGYRRYVGLAVLGTNLHRLGSILQKQSSQAVKKTA